MTPPFFIHGQPSPGNFQPVHGHHPTTQIMTMQQLAGDHNVRYQQQPMTTANLDNEEPRRDNEYDGEAVQGRITSSDLQNVHTVPVVIAVVVGFITALVLTQLGARDAVLTQWLAMAPGKLFTNAIICVTLPTIFVNSVLGAMHFSTLNKNRALLGKITAYFIGLTVWASVVGTLLAACFVAVLPQDSGLVAAIESANSTSVSLSFRCPDSNYPLVLHSDGTMICSATVPTPEATAFMLEDVAHTYRLYNTSDIPSIAEQSVQVLESFFPENMLLSFLQGDILNLVIIGAVLGLALTKFTSMSFIAGGADSSMLFSLVMQSEVMLSRVLRGLVQLLPFAMPFVVCEAILHALNTPSVVRPSAPDVVAFVGVLLFALLVDVATVVLLTILLTKTNPVAFLKHMLPAQAVAFGSGSAFVALPTTVRSIASSRQVSMPLAHFVCSTGLVLNRHGSVLYLSVATTFVLATMGHTGATSAGNLLLLMLTATLCSFVPSRGAQRNQVLGTILLRIYDIDSSAAGILLSYVAVMEWITDPFVAVANVTNDALIAFILAHQLDERFMQPAGILHISQEDQSRRTHMPPRRRTTGGISISSRVMSL